MKLKEFLNRLENKPSDVQFIETIALIDELYEFTPTAFQNGLLRSEAGQNSGSCKIFSFAKMNGLTVPQTLSCFGDYYRKDVLEHPDATDHQNIRNFMVSGWAGIQFDSDALKATKPQE